MKEFIDTLASACTEALSSPQIKGAIAGATIAFIRVMYDNKEPRMMRKLLESSLCGLIAWTTSYILPVLGMTLDLSIFVGGVVGLLGADKVRSLANTFAAKKARQDHSLLPADKPSQTNPSIHEGEGQ